MTADPGRALISLRMSNSILHNRLILALQEGRIAALRRDGMEIVLAKGQPYRRLRLRLHPRGLSVVGERRHPPLADLLDAAFGPDVPPVFVRRETLVSLPLRGGRWAATPAERAVQAVLLLADAAGAPARAALAALAEHALALVCPARADPNVVLRVEGAVCWLEGSEGTIAIPGVAERLRRIRISTGLDVWHHAAPIVLEIVPMEASAHARAAARGRPPMPAGLGGRIPRLKRIRIPRRRAPRAPGIPVASALAPSALRAWACLA